MANLDCRLPRDKVVKSIDFNFKFIFGSQCDKIGKVSSLYQQNDLLSILNVNRVNRPHTTGKNARNMKSVSQIKLLYFEGIFKL